MLLFTIGESTDVENTIDLMDETLWSLDEKEEDDDSFENDQFIISDNGSINENYENLYERKNQSLEYENFSKNNEFYEYSKIDKKKRIKKKKNLKKSFWGISMKSGNKVTVKLPTNKVITVLTQVKK